MTSSDSRRSPQLSASERALLPLCLLLLSAFALGALGLNRDIVWLDEMFSLGNMGAFDPAYSPAQVVESLAQHSPDHAPLYFVLGAQWSRLAGWTQLPARYLSLLLGLLLVAFLYRFTAYITNRQTGLCAALLISSSGFVLLYFHEIRMYTLLMLLAVWHVHLYFRLIKSDGDDGGWQLWALFVMTAAALIYTHVYAIFLFAALLGQHLVFRRHARRWLSIMLAWAIGAAAFLPYLPIFLLGFADVTTSSDTQAMAFSTPELLAAVLHPLVNDMLILWLPIVLLAGLWLRRARSRHIARLAAVVALIFLCIIALNAVYPVISVNRIRYFLIGMPFYIVVLAALLMASPVQRALRLLFLLIWIAGGINIVLQAENWTYAGHQTLLMDHPPLNRFADSLMGKVKSQDFLLGFAGSPAINWRLKHGYSKGDYYAQVALGIDGAFVNARLRGDALQQDLQARIDSHPYLLFAYDPRDTPPVFDDVSRALQADYRACAVLADSPDVFIQRYVLKPLDCGRDYQPIQYENGIHIVDKFAFFSAEERRLRLYTGWQVADEEQLDMYNVSIQLFSSDGQKALQTPDRHLYDDVLTWYALDISTADLPPGGYSANVILYNRYGSESKVRGKDLTTGEAGLILPLLHFTISE